MNPEQAKTILETVLLSSDEPLTLNQLVTLFEQQLTAECVQQLLQQLQQDWLPRGIELKLVSSGWRFQAKKEYQRYIDLLHPEKPPRYSRAVMETLAIIAYR